MNKKPILFAMIVLFLSSFLMFWRLDHVDLEASEDIYVSDSVGYLRGDPFIAPRHHLRKPHAPASPHPFFAQWLTFLSLKQFGLTLTAARLVQASAIVASTGVIMLLAHTVFASWQTAVLSGLVFATFPLVVRFGRMAVLDSVLVVVQSLGMLWLWFALHRRGVVGYFFAALVGIAYGLSISTKLTGVFFAGAIVLPFAWCYWRTRSRYFVHAFAVFVLATGAIFVLFNDPYSYIYGWLNFSDPKHQNISVLAVLQGIVAFEYWSLFVPTLLGIMPFAVLVYSVWRYRAVTKNIRRIFLLSWILAPLSYLLLNPVHITGLSAEWSYLPLFAPLAMVVGHSLHSLWKKYVPSRQPQYFFILMLLYISVIGLPLVWYGLRFRQLPVAAYYNTRNVSMGDLAVTRIINQLNTETDDVLVLVVTKGIDFPLWMLADNIATEPFYSPLESYDYIVTDNPDLAMQAQEAGFYIWITGQNPTEPEVFLLRR